MIMKSGCFTIVILLLTIESATARTWLINEEGSGDAPTIQAGIDNAATTDTVRALPGRYFEHINFKGKAIVVIGSGAEFTVIDGSREVGPCVTFDSGEDRRAVLCDFTITGGTGFTRPSFRAGGGIYIIDSGPRITSNIITQNEAYVRVEGRPQGSGGGIVCGCVAGSPSPLIEYNLITDNLAGVNGGGIGIDGYTSPTIRSNIIKNNKAETGDGGGIWLLVDSDGGGIENNLIEGNIAGDHGGGIYVANPGSSPTIPVEIIGNVIASNLAKWQSRVASAGGGIWLGKTEARIHQNTIVFNVGGSQDSSAGGAIGLDRSGSSVIERNIIAFSEGGGIRCDGNGPAIIQSNLTWQNGGEAGLGLCEGWELKDDNIVADPYFCNGEIGVFTLAEDSPALLHPSGPLGAFALPGCGPVSVYPTTWGALKIKYLSSTPYE